MHVSHFARVSLGSTALFASLAVTPLSAQAADLARPSAGVVLETSGPAIHHVMDYATGAIRMSSMPQGALAATQVCFDNSIDVDPGGIGALDALLYPAGNELFDWGVKLCGESWYVDELTIGYASLAPTSVGGSLTLRLYEGSLGWGNPGTLRKEFVLQNLPSDPNFTNPLWPRMLTIELGADAFYWPDGPIGWSIENSDGWTAPLLVDATIQNGVQNFFDVYTPGPASAATYDDTYFLPPGGVSNDPIENSFYIQVNQNSVVPTAVPIPGGMAGTPNPSVFTTSTLPWVDWTWTADVDVGTFPGSNVTIAFVSPQRLTGAFIAAGELIANTALPGARFSVLGAGQSHAFPIPNDPGLLGRVFYAQGGFLSPIVGPTLTNGYELTIGSY